MSVEDLTINRYDAILSQAAAAQEAVTQLYSILDSDGIGTGREDLDVVANALREVTALHDFLDGLRQTDAFVLILGFGPTLSELEGLDGPLFEIAVIARNSITAKTVSGPVMGRLRDALESLTNRSLSISKKIRVNSRTIEDGGARRQVEEVVDPYGASVLSSHLQTRERANNRRVRDALVEAAARQTSMAAADRDSADSTRVRRHQAVIDQLDSTLVLLTEFEQRADTANVSGGSALGALLRSARESVGTILRFYAELADATPASAALVLESEILTYTEALTGHLLVLRATASRSESDAADAPPLALARVRDELHAINRNFERAASGVLKAAQRVEDAVARDLLVRIAENYGTLVVGERFLLEAKDARDRTLEVLDSAKQAAGEVGSTEQARHYQIYATREQRSANLLRLGTVLLLLGIAGIASFVLFRSSNGPDIVAELSRLGIALPLAVLAAYTGREASRHRQSANWAQQLAMKLLTFDAFVQALNDDTRATRRSDFAAHLFGATETPPVSTEKGPSVVAELVSLLEAARGIASTEKPTDKPKDGGV